VPTDTILGRDVLLYFLVNGIYQQAACATECSLNVHTDTVEVTTKTHNKGEGTWRKLKPVFNSWSASVSGIQLLDTPLKFSDIRQMQTDLTTVYIQYTKVSKSGTRYENWFAAGVVTDTNETAGVDDFAQFDINIEGYGALTADFDPTNLNQPLEMFYYYEADGTEGRSWIISDLIGYLTNGRIYREGVEISASGTQPMNRTASDIPTQGKYKWDATEGRLTLSDSDPVLSFGERIDIPYTNSYAGCSLSIAGFKAALNSDNKFILSWQGSGLPLSQLLFEYSDDYGATYQLLTVDIDAVNMDNAVVAALLDTTQSYVFRITPICTNQAKGKASTAYWNTIVVHITNNRADGRVITHILYPFQINGEYPLICNDANTQLTTVTGTVNPYSTANYIKVNVSGMPPFTYTATVKNMNGAVLGTATKIVDGSGAFPNQATISLNAYLPNEFTVILD
jgi:predicted secreted protein